MRKTGEAIMNMFATNRAHKPSRLGSLAIFSGTVLGAVGAVGPALSADLPDDYPPYRPTYYQNSYSDYNSCYSCRCCGHQFVHVTVPPPVIEERPPVAVAERHWVQRDYIERYPSYAAESRYGYPPYPGPDRYSSHYPDYPRPGAESYPAYEPPPYREPRRRFSSIGAYYPPAPAAYEYESEPAHHRFATVPYHRHDYYRPSYEPEYKAAYEYKPVYEYKPTYEYKPAYEYEPSPRPPAAVPGGYYGPGYSE
jgi:hypothetical protein